jgi:hypothetical protein
MPAAGNRHLVLASVGETVLPGGRAWVTRGDCNILARLNPLF